MIPITVAVIGGQATGEQSAGRKPLTAFFLSLIYVLGISIVYSAMGVAAASTGSLFGTALQSPWVIGFVVAVFVGLAMSMFGVYYLRVPSFISDRLGTGTRKGIIGVFVMGLVSGIIASPCIGPALASLLVYIASTGNKFLGILDALCLCLGTWRASHCVRYIFRRYQGTAEIWSLDGNGRKNIWTPFNRGGALLCKAHYLRERLCHHTWIVFNYHRGIFGGFDRLTHESTTFQRAKSPSALSPLSLGHTSLSAIL